MKTRFCPSKIIFPALLIVLFWWVPLIPAQTDPDPNSPAPIVITYPDSIRALARPAAGLGRKKAPSRKFFRVGEKIRLPVTGVELMPGEGAGAFRVYARDAGGRPYRFPVIELRPVTNREWIYELTVLVKNDLLPGKQPPETGDLLLTATWRGLAGNPVRLGLGRTGGKLKEPPGARPMPLAKFAKKPAPADQPPTPEYVGYRYSGDRKRFMEQATFGPTGALDRRLRRIGLRTWLAEQFEMPYPAAENPYPELPSKSIDPDNKTLGCGMFAAGTDERLVCKRDHYTMYPVQNWFFREAFYGRAQLRHRVAWALAQLWVTSGSGVRQAGHMVEYHKVLSRNAFGNFRDLMREVTLHPTMGDYLDMVRSTRETPNENYARELLQLFTVGPYLLNQDGTYQLDPNGQRIPTYRQEAVNDLTRVLTGWRFCNNGNDPRCPRAVAGTINFRDPLRPDEYLHDREAKTLLAYPDAVNRFLPAGQTSETDLAQALDNIFYHPNVAPFISKFLIQQLVRSDPTPAYVGRVAARFNDNGAGVRGDLQAVVRAILLDPEARGDQKTAPIYGKLREPVLLLTNIARHFDVMSDDRTTQSDGSVDAMIEDLGQSVFYSPTVFNFYPPDFVIPGTAVNAPEFGILNTEIAINRYNLIHILVYESRPGGTIHFPEGTSIDLSEMERLSAADPTGVRLVDGLDQKILHRTMPAEMRLSILDAVRAVDETNHRRRAQNAVYLVLTSAQFQIQR